MVSHFCKGLLHKQETMPFTHVNMEALLIILTSVILVWANAGFTLIFSKSCSYYELMHPKFVKGTPETSVHPLNTVNATVLNERKIIFVSRFFTNAS